MRPPGLQVYLQPRVTLTFDLRTTKVDSLASFSRGPLVVLTSKSVRLFSNITFTKSLVTSNRQTNERTRRQHLPVWPNRGIKINHLIATLKPQNNGPSYTNTVIGTRYTGRWWVGRYIWYSEEGTGWGHSPPRPLLAVPNATAHQSTASVPTSYYSMWYCNCLWSLKG